MTLSGSDDNVPRTLNTPVLYEVSAGIARMRIDRPEKRNALNAAVVGALLDCLGEAAADAGVRVVIIEGAGGIFSSGADLSELAALQDASLEENLVDSRRLAQLFERIHTHPRAVIAKIKKAAVAGGCGLAAACDFSIAENDARLGFPEVRIGFVPAIVAAIVLRKIGDAAARELFLSGSLISAERAAAIGLITRAVPPDDLEASVERLAREIATETSPAAIASTKQLLNALAYTDLHTDLDHAAHVNAAARGTSDCKAGITAFLEKTDPPWRRK